MTNTFSVIYVENVIYWTNKNTKIQAPTPKKLGGVLVKHPILKLEPEKKWE